MKYKLKNTNKKYINQALILINNGEVTNKSLTRVPIEDNSICVSNKNDNKEYLANSESHCVMTHCESMLIILVNLTI